MDAEGQNHETVMSTFAAFVHILRISLADSSSALSTWEFSMLIKLQSQLDMAASIMIYHPFPDTVISCYPAQWDHSHPSCNV